MSSSAEFEFYKPTFHSFYYLRDTSPAKQNLVNNEWDTQIGAGVLLIANEFFQKFN